MKMIISFVLVSAIPLALAAPAFAERGHGGEFHDEFRGGHEGSERGIFTTSAAISSSRTGRTIGRPFQRSTAARRSAPVVF
jgi:hypothetical protein